MHSIVFVAIASKHQKFARGRRGKLLINEQLSLRRQRLMVISNGYISTEITLTLTIFNSKFKAKTYERESECKQRCHQHRSQHNGNEPKLKKMQTRCLLLASSAAFFFLCNTHAGSGKSVRQVCVCVVLHKYKLAYHCCC